MPRNISSITRTYRHVNRYAEIIKVLAKHGFGNLVLRLNLEKKLKLDKNIIPKEKSISQNMETFWKRIRMVIEELGPTFIKFGQIMSNRPDLLPDEFIKELERLQDKVKPFSSKEAKEILIKEFDGEFEQVVKNFTEEPFASASMSQVHRAVLKDGQECVIKIRRPGIRKTIEVDLEIMHDLARLIEREITEYKSLNLENIVEEFENSIRKEIDFTIEASNMKRFRRYFGENENLYIPELFDQYSTPRMIITEYIKGFKISLVDNNDIAIDSKETARKITKLMFEQIFDKGFYHADPHPGNIFVLDDGRICMIDFGMMGHILPSQRRFIGKMIMGIIQKKPKKISDALLELSVVDDFEDRERFEHDISLLIDEYRDIEIKKLQVGRLLQDMSDQMNQYQLKIPPDFYMLMKAMISIEGTCRDLDPNFNVIEVIEPYAKKIMLEQINLKNKLNDSIDFFKEFFSFLQKFPNELRDFKKIIKNNSTELRFTDEGIKPLNKTLEKITNRIAFAIVVAALIIGSSIVSHAHDFPLWKDIPNLGTLGFIVAAVMGFWLLISIIRSGRM